MGTLGIVWLVAGPASHGAISLFPRRDSGMFHGNSPPDCSSLPLNPHQSPLRPNALHCDHGKAQPCITVCPKTHCPNLGAQRPNPAPALSPMGTGQGPVHSPGTAASPRSQQHPWNGETPRPQPSSLVLTC